MLFAHNIKQAVVSAMLDVYNKQVELSAVTLQPTRKEFEGDITLVVFNLSKLAGSSPEAVADDIGNYLQSHCAEVEKYNVIKGFLNLVVPDGAWLSVFSESCEDRNFGHVAADASYVHSPVLVEYSSPNTNKPLHLGHIRNNLLGYSIAEILKATGNHVRKVNLVNDRGIHICKSMLAWMKRGNGETPESTRMKGDHLVGHYYVEFDKIYKDQAQELVQKGMERDEALKLAPIMLEAQELLRKWEAGDRETVDLWKKMNGWVYEGFDQTYKLLGVDFDKIYYESETYLPGKAIVAEGLEKGIFFRKNDGSVWVDLTDEGLDQKLLLRGDGTSVYITQDLGTAVVRHDETGFERLIYVVGNEQDYHFKVLKLILKKLGYEWWNGLHHLSYAMVDLPSGKMKSREGTVVDADDLMDQMIKDAERITRELGKIEDFNSEEAENLYRTIGLGALKYYILKVDPEKRMLFNPEESIDFNGHSGPFVQSAYVRCRSVLRKAELTSLKRFPEFDPAGYTGMVEKERDLVILIMKYPEVVDESGEKYNPALIANYAYELAKAYNGFYHEHSIINEEDIVTSLFRLRLTMQTASVIRKSMALLGIEVPERM